MATANKDKDQDQTEQSASTSSKSGTTDYLEIGTGARMTLDNSNPETKRRVKNNEIRELTKEEVEGQRRLEEIYSQTKSDQDRVK